MARFVTGTIIEMQGEYGGYYELELRLQDGNAIPIFYSRSRTERQEHDPISSLLALDKSIEFLIILKFGEFIYSPVVPEGTIFQLVVKEIPRKGGREPLRRNDIQQGKVLDSNWNPSSLSYQAVATQKIFEQRYVLVETAIGQAVIKWATLEKQLGDKAKDIAPGGYLEFSPVRLDILAIL